MKKIRYLRIDQIGFVNNLDGEIEAFQVNGEMALVTWYSQGNREFNGKFVIEVGYEDAAREKSEVNNGK